MQSTKEVKLLFHPSYAGLHLNLDPINHVIIKAEEDQQFQNQFQKLMNTTATQHIPEKIPNGENALAQALFADETIREHIEKARVNKVGSDQTHAACALLELINIFSRLHDDEDRNILIQHAQTVAKLLIACINVYLRIVKNGRAF